MSLAAAEKDLIDQVKENVSVIAAGHPVAEIGQVYEELEEQFEALACCQLLVHAQAGKFREHLLWSALARRHFLQRCVRERQEGDFHAARSRSQAVFCVLAAGDSALALEVGALAPSAPLAEGEYPDDFAYHWLIHLLQQPTPAAQLAEAAAALERADADAARVAVCEAVIGNDAAAFETAFTDLLAARASLMDEERPLHEDHPSFEPRSRLFVEGLAWLRLAEQRGLPPAQPEYPPLCPSLARVRAGGRRPDDIFASL